MIEKKLFVNLKIQQKKLFNLKSGKGLKEKEVI